MGRAMVREPAVFLMDEPLSNLDAKLRVQMRAEIARITRRLGVTTIYVTHDQTEAMTLGSRVAVLKRGVLQQVAAPRELYDRPANLFVAGFIGSPAMNLLRGVFHERAGQDALLLGDQVLPVDAALFEARPGLRAYRDRPVAVGIRPEDMDDATVLPESSTAVLHAVADLTEALGSDLLVHFMIEAPAVVTDDVRELARDAGVEVLSSGETRTEVVARFSPRSTVRNGDSTQVAVDTARLHVFELETGQSIW
jgi:multiple sugar transport system ATP-binding protein